MSMDRQLGLEDGRAKIYFKTNYDYWIIRRQSRNSFLYGNLILLGMVEGNAYVE